MSKAVVTEAARKLLVALDDAWRDSGIECIPNTEAQESIKTAQASLEAALSHGEPEQKPVAWRVYAGGRYDVYADPVVADARAHSLRSSVEPLFASPVRSAQEAVKVTSAMIDRLVSAELDFALAFSDGGAPSSAKEAELKRELDASREAILSALLPPGGETATPPAPGLHVRCRDCDGYNCDDGCAYPDPAPVSHVTAWEHISSAPRDGSEVLVWNGRSRHVAHYDRVESEWVSPYRTTTKRLPVMPKPTLWQPLPAPPATTEGSDNG